MDAALWWSGLLTWITSGIVGMFWLADQIIEWAVPTFWTKREFLAFVADRVRKRRSSVPAE